MKAQRASVEGKYLGSALWVLCALLTGCVPNRQVAYPTAEAIRCSPNDVFLSDVASRTSDGDIVETWDARCLGNQYKCTRSKGVTRCQPVTAEMVRQPASPPAAEPAQPVVGSPLTQTIFPLIQRIWNAHRQGDAIGEGELLTHDYTSVQPDGSFHSGKRTSEEIQGAPIGAFILSDVRIDETSPDAVLATYVATVEIPGASKLSKFAVSEVWVKRSGEWKRRYFQATPLP